LVTDITCYASQPPLIYESTFEKVPDTAIVHVPSNSISAYKSAQYWSRFRIVALDEQQTVLRKVIVDAAQTTADFTWPTDEAAHSYQIDIYQDGTVFCRLTLGSKGQLLGINCSNPAKRVPTMSNAETALPSTLFFTVTGLDEASRYNYVLSVLDETNKPIHVYIGDFATIGYSGELKGGGDEVIPTPPIIPSNPEAGQLPTGLWLNTENKRNIKCTNSGIIYIERDGKRYTLQGMEIR
jgi:hypothetical protein